MKTNTAIQERQTVSRQGKRRGRKQNLRVHPETVRRPAETPHADHPGLCVTCKHTEHCDFPRREGHAVLTCDEFEGDSVVRRHALVPRPAMTERAALANREWYPGLCTTCTRLPTCTFPKPEGGVWNCDEFE